MREILIFFLYRSALALAFPFLLLYLAYRAGRDGRYRRGLAERFGGLPAPLGRTPRHGIWLHAVSVGEILSLPPLLRKLRAEMPGVPLVLSCGTVAGRTLAEEKLRSLVEGIFYLPLDYVFAVRRVLRAIEPRLVVILETEIWPNLYRETKRRGAGLLVVNGRISTRAIPRYRRLRWFFSTVLALPDRILVQSRQDQDHYRQAGAPPERVEIAGNLKFDFDPGGPAPEEIADWLRTRAAERVWMAASTMPPAEPGDPDEDDVVIDVHRQLLGSDPDLLLILVPRKPERFDEAARKLDAAGLRYVRRSALAKGEPTGAQVLLLDSVGELGRLFPAADVVFMGGTLPRRGGHNILEPAFHGRAIVTGPHMENFAAIAASFQAGSGAQAIERPEQLAGAVAELLHQTDERDALGARARVLALAQRGATGRAVGAIEAAYWNAIPVRRHALPIQLALRALSLVWATGGKMKRALARPGRLPVPVISVGGLAMGGAGKTPFVDYLLAGMKGRGWAPGLLTRGYGRAVNEPLLVAPDEPLPPVAATGEEAQILLRRHRIAAGIGGDRLALGERMLDRKDAPAPGVMVLDDGFQHARLARDFDIVLLDGLDPLAGGLFPLGRLREPLAALRRAGVVIFNRVPAGRRCPQLEALVRRERPDAWISYARVRPAGWHAIGGGGVSDAVGSTSVCGAFCGLGNPDAFWSTLREMDWRTAFAEAFPDHHRYTVGDLERLKARCLESGATVLLTTEKDAANLPDGVEGMLAPLRLSWLRIELELEGEEELWARMERVVKPR